MSDPKISQAVDDWLESKLIDEDEALKATIQTSDALDIPPIAVSPTQGAFLSILVKSIGAKRILELGTLAGYSTIWLARALAEDGRLVSLELHQRNIDLATENLTAAGVRDRVNILQGPAERSLNILVNDGVEPFDFIFMDADKVNYPVYLERVLELSRPGTLIFADNVIRNGGVVDPDNDDPAIRGIRTFMDMVSDNPRLEATAIQTVGSKGYDGFALIRVI